MSQVLTLREFKQNMAERVIGSFYARSHEDAIMQADRYIKAITNEDGHYKFYIYTQSNEYCLSVCLPGPGKKSYLGCIATALAKRAGEDHHRGNDLPDGELTMETLDEIISAIFCYELKFLSVNTMDQKYSFSKIGE